MRSLRISVTDRCNLRCNYCMPERDYVWLSRAKLLNFREIVIVAGAFSDLGVDRIRLTGGEPLIRTDIEVLVEMLAGLSGIHDLALTTNGTLLAAKSDALVAAGLQRVTVSLDSLRPERFRSLAGRDQLAEVLAGIEAAAAAGFGSVKINTVVMRGVNDDEIADILDYGRSVGAEVRFIEYMDVGGATEWQQRCVVARAEILETIERHNGAARPLGGDDAAPADRFALEDGTVFGIISSTTQPFCSACDRGRVTADGMFYLCLYGVHGADLREVLRSGASRSDLAAFIRSTWRQRTDRGAEERLGLAQRRAWTGVSELREDPHLEMHTRGG